MKHKNHINKSCVCNVMGCSKKARIHGVCHNHYQRIYYRQIKIDGVKIIVRNTVVG